MNTLQMQAVLDSIDELRGRQITTAKAMQVLLTFHPDLVPAVHAAIAQMQMTGLGAAPSQSLRAGVSAAAREILP